MEMRPFGLGSLAEKGMQEQHESKEMVSSSARGSGGVIDLDQCAVSMFAGCIAGSRATGGDTGESGSCPNTDCHHTTA